MEANSHVNIYVLKCRGAKYYIGRSANVITRTEQHMKGYGSAWTKKYRPVEIIETIPNCDKFDEDKYTLKYMDKYGINNVRGGTWVEVELSVEQIRAITRQLDGANDRCHNCSETGHFIRHCPYEVTYQNNGIIKSIGEELINLSVWLWGNEKIKKLKQRRDLSYDFYHSHDNPSSA